MNRFAPFLAIGSEIIGLILVAYYAGDWLDKRFQGQGLWVGLLVILALVLWFVRIILLLKRKKQD